MSKTVKFLVPAPRCFILKTLHCTPLVQKQDVQIPQDITLYTSGTQTGCTDTFKIKIIQENFEIQNPWFSGSEYTGWGAMVYKLKILDIFEIFFTSEHIVYALLMTGPCVITLNPRPFGEGQGYF